ncbi:MAG: phosphoribosylanthranilate isomerase [Minwuia sp.]|uniref:phosphoribosylanthranilate isomerase n=1 Tax=Minwuia sp. TaxID=2493630 RepID=UPI003A8C1CC8
MSRERTNPVLIAIDTGDIRAASGLIAATTDHVGGVKLGLEYYMANGPEGVRKAAPGGVPLFLDVKLHDIPNTVAGAVSSAAQACTPDLMTIHAQGGPAMIRAAREASDAFGDARPRIIAVTVLTSLDDSDLAQMGVAGSTEEQVVRLGRMAVEAGADGLVCSPMEIGPLREALGMTPILVVPGIRPAGSAVGDQKRVMTPREAVEAGASYIVVGQGDHGGRRSSCCGKGGGRRGAGPMSVSVKICGLGTPADVDAALEGGADAVGFVFYPPSPRNLDPETAATLAERAGAVLKVGLFVDPEDAWLDKVLAKVPLDIIQLHGSETPARVEQIRARTGLPAMKAIKISDAEDFGAVGDYDSAASWLLFDARPPKGQGKGLPGGNGVAFDWRLMQGRTCQQPWMLSGGLHADNVREAVETSGAGWVDVSSGVESEPGRKDPKRIAEFLAAAKSI